MNKKNKVVVAEKKVAKLTESTFKLQEYVAVLKNENHNMKIEISYLMNLIKSNPVMESLFNQYVMNPQFFDSLNPQLNDMSSTSNNNCHVEYLSHQPNNMNVPYSYGGVVY